ERAHARFVDGSRCLLRRSLVCAGSFPVTSLLLPYFAKLMYFGEHSLARKSDRQLCRGRPTRGKLSSRLATCGNNGRLQCNQKYRNRFRVGPLLQRLNHSPLHFKARIDEKCPSKRFTIRERQNGQALRRHAAHAPGFVFDGLDNCASVSSPCECLDRGSADDI